MRRLNTPVPILPGVPGVPGKPGGLGATTKIEARSESLVGNRVGPVATQCPISADRGEIFLQNPNIDLDKPLPIPKHNPNSLRPMIGRSL